jgi:hypothetical protein
MFRGPVDRETILLAGRHSPATVSEEIVAAREASFGFGESPMSRAVLQRQASAAEVFGLVVGGGALVALLSGQVLFLMWMM